MFSRLEIDKYGGMIMAHETLVRLLNHPVVRMHLKPEILAGLTGTTQIDYAIGVVVEAVKLCPFDRNLGRDLKKIREEYPLYFKETSLIDETNTKNPAYKACNGF